MNKEVYNYISKNIHADIIGGQQCKRCGDTYPLFEKEMSYLKQQNLPISDLCFLCRFRNLLLWRNERNLYWDKSSKSGQKIMSIYYPNKKRKVYNYDEWDKECGFNNIYKNLDNKEDFINEYYTLLNEIPIPGTDIFWENENIRFCNRIGRVKNAYYSFCCFSNCEDIYFSHNISGGKDIYDSSNIYSSSLVYDSVRIFGSHQIFFSDDIYDSKNIYFSYDMRDCDECLFCSNLVGKKYMIYNKPYTKEEYNEHKKNLFTKVGNTDELQTLQNSFENLKKKAIRKGTSLIATEKSIGDQLRDSNNTLLGFWMLGADDCFNSANGFPAEQKRVYNSFGFGIVENLYFSLGCGGITNGFYSINIEDSSDIYFSQKLKGCHHCIGCYGLQNVEYHILNKKYTKEEYEIKFRVIMKELNQSGGLKRFYDVEESPFPINDTYFFSEFPVEYIRFLQSYEGGDYTKYKYKELINNKNGRGIIYVFDETSTLSEAILDLGGEEKIKTSRRNKISEIDVPENMQIIQYDELSKSIGDIQNDILEKAIICKHSGRPFRIMKKELEFYRKHNITLPYFHPDIRITKRAERKAKLGLYKVNCNKCQKEMLATYREQEGLTLYCDDCYDKTIY